MFVLPSNWCGIGAELVQDLVAGGGTDQFVSPGKAGETRMELVAPPPIGGIGARIGAELVRSFRKSLRTVEEQLRILAGGAA